MKRLTLLIALALAAGVLLAGPSNAVNRTQCRFPGRSDRKVRRTIRCAVDQYHVPGGVHQALYIAKRESGFECDARNSRSTAGGVYQVLIGTWHGFHRRLEKRGRRWWHRRWDLSHSRFNCRANVIASIRVAHASGWDPWAV